MTDNDADDDRRSLIDSFLRRAGKVAGGTFDRALDVATMSSLFGESWVRDLLVSGASPERLEAMAEAGHFLRDARETAGLTIAELADRLDLSDDGVLENVERGEALLPLEVMLRAASLLARHDPVPFLIRFLRSYNPRLEAALEQWGVMALPRNYERERRFINLYRQHDFLRDLSDDAFARFIDYMDSSTKLVVDVMERESESAVAERAQTAKGTKRAKSKTTTAKKAETRRTKPKRATTSSRKADARASGSARATAESAVSGDDPKPVVRKVAPKRRKADSGDR